MCEKFVGNDDDAAAGWVVVVVAINDISATVERLANNAIKRVNIFQVLFMMNFFFCCCERDRYGTVIVDSAVAHAILYTHSLP